MILVVDDHADTRQPLVRLFLSHGLDAQGAVDGAEALAMVTAKRPHVMLLDYNMPGMNGLEVLTAIRAKEETRDLPVLMFTAMSGDIEEKAKSLGVQGYIRKCSFDWNGLVDQLRQYVRQDA